MLSVLARTIESCAQTLEDFIAVRYTHIAIQ
jgi:hypothetical protein